ncbi:MAG: hypothetical protein IID40_03220 [Planctomycetes bacterium]|nr:hypothetical protein [Planctomycetota bacterium]
MTRRLRWWWWSAAVLAALGSAGLIASFVWVFGGTDSAGRYYVYLEHGMLGATTGGARPAVGALPWYAQFEAYRTGTYTPWKALPSFDFSTPGMWNFTFPIHLPLLALLAIVTYPLLPFALRRNRRKRGLCLKCGYDLTGNTSGVCPECGAAI